MRAIVTLPSNQWIRDPTGQYICSIHQRYFELRRKPEDNELSLSDRQRFYISLCYDHQWVTNDHCLIYLPGTEPDSDSENT
jgi:hypothetical protein